MYRGYIYGRDLFMAGSPYALLAFKREFGEDLPTIAKHVQKRFVETEQIDIASLLGICWAMCKSYDDRNTPNFSQWFADFGFEDGDIPDDVGEAILAFDQIWTAVEQELFVFDRPNKGKPTIGNGNDEEKPEEYDKTEWVEWGNVLSLLHLGFSLDDIQHMPMSDFIAYTDLMSASDEEQKTQTVIEADQAAIDRLFF